MNRLHFTPSLPDAAPSVPSASVATEMQTDLAFRSTLSPEAEFVLLSARTQLKGARLERWEQLLTAEQPTLNWKIVTRLAASHRVLGLLGRHLSGRSWGGIAPQIRHQLQSYFMYATTHSHALKSELARLSYLLESAGIPVVSFKGHTLGLAAYGNAVVRPSADIDLLVARADALRARDLLATKGYGLEVTLQAKQEKHVLRQDSVFNLFRPTEPHLQTVLPHGYPVELHWAVTSPCLPSDLEFQTLAPRLGWIELSGVTAGEFSGNSDEKAPFQVRSLAPEDLLLVLCVHGAKHLWERLIWICDLAELLDKTPDFNWTLLLDAARERGILRMTALGLALIRSVLGTELPREVEAWLSTQPEALRLASQVRHQLLSSVNDNEGQLKKHSLSATAMLVQSIDAPRDRIEFLWHVATVPSIDERATLNLHPKWDFLWCVMRPARALQKRLVNRKIGGDNEQEL